MTDTPFRRIAPAVSSTLTREDVFGPAEPRLRDLFPLTTANDAPLRFEPPSAVDLAERDAIAAMIHRHIGDIAAAQHAAIDQAVAVALVEGLDVHVHRRYDSRFVGIELAEPQRPYAVPVLYDHDGGDRWEDWW